MPRLYDRQAIHDAMERRERLHRRWKLDRAPPTVACRQLGVDHDGLQELVRRGLVQAFPDRKGRIVYDCTGHPGM